MFFFKLLNLTNVNFHLQLDEDENIRRFLDENIANITNNIRPETPVPSTSELGRSFSRLNMHWFLLFAYIFSLLCLLIFCYTPISHFQVVLIMLIFVGLPLRRAPVQPVFGVTVWREWGPLAACPLSRGSISVTDIS